MKRILVELEVFEEALMAASESGTFEELGWLHDSGMICTGWKEVPLHEKTTPTPQTA